MLELQGLLISAHDLDSTAEAQDPATNPTPAEPANTDGLPDAPEEAASEAELLNFEEVFTDILCKFVHERLALFM
jgi:hypothetical protein